MKKVLNLVEENMTEFPSVTSPKLPIKDAYELMMKKGIRHLPVVVNEKVVGLVSQRDLTRAHGLSKSAGFTVEDVMSSEVYCVPVGTPLSVVTKEMALRKLGSAVILSTQGKVTGIFTTTDAMLILSKILASNRGPEFRNWAVERLIDAGPFLETAAGLGI